MMRVSSLFILFIFLLSSVLSDVVVYDGTTGNLASGWQDFSWATHNLKDTSNHIAGHTYSASMVCAGWQGLYLHDSVAFDLPPYNTFSFWMNAGPSASSIVMTVQLIGTANSINLQVADYTANKQLPTTWTQIKIPLASFGAMSGNSINGFWFQANGGPTVYFDNISFISAVVPPQSGPALSVNAGQMKYSINPNIYGVTIWWSGMTVADKASYTSFVKDVKLPLNRIGGDSTTRYNWQVDASNAGFDWYFMGGSGNDTYTPGGLYDGVINTNKPLGVKTVVTIPMIQYINKLTQWGCSFPTSVYGPQQSQNPYVHPNGDNCGNGVDPSGNNILDTNPLATDVPNTPAIQKAFVQHIVSKWGNSGSTGTWYQLDNEVSNWAYMHRDVHPQPVTQAEIVSQTILYAAAVKEGDATAKVAAPSEIQFAWYPDWGGLNNVIYFLNQIKAYETANSRVILDSYDAHYPDANDNHWPVLYDVDKLRQTVDATYPGKGISFSEWTMAGVGPLGGALAMADQFGHFMKNKVLFASIWGMSVADTTAPLSYGLRIFRNYDGKGSVFGDVYVNGTSAADGTLSIHAATRSSDRALTILVINKVATGQTSTLSLSGFTASGNAKMFQYSATNPSAIVALPDKAVGTSFSYTYAPYSLTMIVVPNTKPIVTVCVGPVAENANVVITCPSAGQTIKSVTFASYGNPVGACGSFATSTCNSVNSVSVTQRCVGQNSCTFAASNGVFDDPCFGTLKHYNGQVTCQ